MVGVVIAGESDGLVGAAIRRSPVCLAKRVDPFVHPGTRDWLSFTPEPEYSRRMALAVGVAMRQPVPTLVPFVRPLLVRRLWRMGRSSWGTFTRRSFPIGRFPVARSSWMPRCAHLFEPGRIEAILHLLGDARPILGRGESTFTRGAFWYVPLIGRRGDEHVMTLLIGSWTIGLILAMLALGVFISFRIFAFPDITADGSLTLGAAVAAALIARGYSPWAATRRRDGRRGTRRGEPPASFTPGSRSTACSPASSLRPPSIRSTST